MLSPRSNFGMAIVEDRLFVVGGISGHGCLSYNLSFQFVVGQYYGKGGSLKAEYYQADSHSWVKICDLRYPKNALTCCTVSNVPNM